MLSCFHNNFWNPPLLQGHFHSFLLFYFRYSNCNKARARVPTRSPDDIMTYNETPQACPNTTAHAPISTYSQGQGSLEHFGDKSKGNIQVQYIVYFISRSSSVLLLICYLRLDHFILCFTTLIMDNGLRCISTVQEMKCVFSPSKKPSLSLFLVRSQFVSQIFINHRIGQRLANRVVTPVCH